MAPPRGGKVKAGDAAPTRAVDAALANLQHLHEQERVITSRVLPTESPLDAAFKAPEPLPHSYIPAGSRPKPGVSALAAPISLKVPTALMGVGKEAGMAHSAPLPGEDPAGAAPLLSYQKVRRWDMLPKHAWLQAAESGQAPGPGFRDVSATQTMRSYGPKGLPPLPLPVETHAASAGSEGYVRKQPTTTIASHYSPHVRGLHASTLAHAVLPDEDEESVTPPSLSEDEVASTFLPLEFFDGGEMEPMTDDLWDKAESYFSKGKPFKARSKYYASGGKTSSMLPCEVVRYHAEEAKFEIQWVHTGKRKLCTRLNLLFDLESEVKWRLRCEKATELRAQFEAAMRYHLLATEQLGVNVSLSDVSEVLDEARLMHRIPGCDESLWATPAMKSSWQQVASDYTGAMRRAHTDYEMRSAAFRATVAALKLPTATAAHVPEMGTVESFTAAFKAAHKAVAGALFAADPVLLRCVRIVFDESYWLRTESLLESRPDVLNTPCDLKHFLEVQATKTEEVKARFTQLWTPAVEAVTQQELSAIPEMERTMDLATYEASRVPRILRQLSLLMQDELQSLVLSSMGAYLQLLQLYATPQDEIEVTNGPPETALAFAKELPMGQPTLLTVTLRLEGGALVFEPSLEKVVNDLNAVLEAIVTQTAGVPSIESHVMHMLGLPETTLKTLAHDDATLQAARVQLFEFLERSLVRPKALLGLFKQFEELAAIEIEAYLETIKAKKCTLEQYHELIIKWNSTVSLVMDATVPEVNCRLLLISCTELKQGLATKAEAIARGVSGLVVEELEKKSKDISAAYSVIYEKLQSTSGSAEEVVEMNAYMAACEIELEKLTESIKTNLEARITLLDNVTMELPDETFSLVFATLGWPGRVTKVATDAAKKQEEDREKFQEQLRTDREHFSEELDVWAVEIKALATLGDMSEVETNSATVAALQAKIDDGKERAALYNSREELFGWPVTEYSQLNELNKALEPYNTLWTTAVNFQRAYPLWLEGPFMELSPEQVEKDVGDWWRLLYKLGKSLTGLPGPLKVVNYVKEKIDDFKQHLPLIGAMLNPGMRDRHWKQLAEQVGKPIQPNEMSTLALILEQKTGDYIAQIQEMSDAASKEFSLEKALDKMLNEWRPIQFDCMEYRDTGTYILRALDEIQSMFDDHVVKTQAMRGSPFVKPFENRCRDWEAKLISMQEIIDEWLKCQSVWLYLEPIFSSEDIMRQMPQEAKRFTQVDRLWRKVMAATEAKPNVLLATATEGMLASWQEANRLLELIQKGLNDYLEAKRLSFARLFFLSNDELLQILSETKDPTRVQPHLGKCFEGITKVDFDDKLIIHGMISAEGEKVPFKQTLDPNAANGMVEKWLLQVESAMKENVSHQFFKGHANYTQRPRLEWLLNWPGQVVLGVDQVFWTLETEEALNSGGNKGLREYEAKCTEQLDGCVELVKKPLNKMQRITLGAMVTLDVHGRDVLTMMGEMGVDSCLDFNWVAQLRLYYNPAQTDGMIGPDLDLKMITAHVKYGWEYLGNSFRLVVTALTDRCYRTLMGAIQLTLGGAPEGPAGTGKTETTKDLAKALAKQCVVFNCSDGLDYLAMAKFFKGVAAAGAWACFDEFNRIDLEVLSVVAQQVLTIQRAIAAGVQRFIFEGTDLAIDPTNAVFITMNPGYAGRSELPDNLKVLFRTVAMMVPDYGLIGEISLMSFGFTIARPLSKKIVQTYKLCSEQLSSQDHYDYGMRAVKSVLTAAGNLKRALPNDPEPMLVLRSIRDVNLPKFLSHDVPLFNGITSDLFPGVQLPPPDYDMLKGAIFTIIEKKGLQAVDSFVTKVLEVYEMFLVRHGFMVVGLPFAGKTCAYRTLAEALTLLNEQHFGKPTFFEEWLKVATPCLNPKSVPAGRLYGEFDPVSHEWTDGILAVIYRTCAQDTTGVRQWMVFDGPVDAVWIENMNTVLDDNKKLCLMSGEIIAMSRIMNLIFEPMDLAVASPATVSRCGMVYMEPHSLGWQPVLTSWLQKLPKNVDQAQRQSLKVLFDWFLDPILWYLRKDCRSPVPTMDIMLAVAVMRFIEAHLDIWIDVPEQPSRAPDSKKGTEILQGLFFFALIWGVGATVDAPSREKFDFFLKQLLKKEVPEILSTPGASQPIFADVKLTKAPPVDKGTVFDCCFDQTRSWAWIDWTKTVPEYSVPKGAKFGDIFVTTIDSVQASYVVDTCITHGIPVLLAGNTGTGKSVLVRDRILNGINSEAAQAAKGIKDVYNNIFISFSAQTSQRATQNLIDNQLDKRRKGVFGPPFGKKTVIFVDDLNMPMLQTYGDQPPVEILRQWMDHNGWYDLKDCTFRELVDIQFVAAMGPPGGGRNPVTPRYIRHFNLMWATDYAPAALERIFKTIFDWHFNKDRFPGECTSLGNGVVQATINIFNTIARELLPTPSKSHYTFNLRDLTKVFQGMTQGSPKTVLEKVDLLRLWAHETKRVFSDRLVDKKDMTWFHKLVCTQLEEVFKSDWKKVTGSEDERLIFGDFMKDDGAEYEVMASMPGIIDRMTTSLEDHNAISKAPMDLVLFPFAAEHVCRILRIVKQPFGNVLSVGVGGSGRQSLTRLACHMADFTLFRIELTKSYDMVAWREDLKKVLRGAGEKLKPTVFLFTDTQVKDEAMVEDINNILNTGEVPQLFPGDEVSQICETLQPKAKEVGMTDFTPGSMMRFFVQNCRGLLHMALCMSPIGDSFRTRLRKFPSLVNCTTIDWFTAWPKDALLTVAQSFLQDIKMEDSVRKAVQEMCCSFQESVADLSYKYLRELKRNNYVTPTSYLELLASFKSLLDVKRSEVAAAKSRYDVGLQKLSETAASVAGMQQELQALQPQLVVARKDADALMIKIDADSKEAAKVKEIVSKDKAAAEVVAANASAIKADCEAGLAEALPALDAAVKALATLKKADIDEVKGMKVPPAGVVLTMEAVCIMKEIKPEKVPAPDGKGKVDSFWGPAKTMMQDTKFLDSLVSYDKDNIDVGIMKKIRDKYMPDPGFVPEIVKKASTAAFGLCCWVRAMETYDRVAKDIAPKRAKLAGAEAEYAEVSTLLASKMAALKEVEDKLALLQATFEETTAKKESLEAQSIDCANKLERAEKLIGGLGGEKDRWTEASRKLGVTYTNITGDVLIGSGVVSYMGPFVATFRDLQISAWIKECAVMKVPCSDKFALVDVLGDQVKIRQWNIDGLPKDSFSTDNGIITDSARRWPLMIDPQMQANKWVKKMSKSSNLVTFKLSDGDFARALENALNFGNPTLLENVLEELDPVLEPVLLKQIFKSGGVLSIKLGDSVVEYNKNFKFYITTKLRNPHYLPEVSVKVTLLNFMITPEGLEDQMLGIVVAKERPELEEEKTKLVLEAAQNKRVLKEVEDKILHTLSSSEGNILDDASAIEILGDAKVISDQISAKQVIADKTTQKLDAIRESYKSVAYRSSILFFSIAAMANIDPMYQFSLAWYQSLFEKAIEQAEPSKKLEERLKNIIKTNTYSVYRNVCRSLYEKDKLLFSFVMCTNIMRGDNKLDAGQFTFFLTGGTGIISDNAPKNPTADGSTSDGAPWLAQPRWEEILRLSLLPGFADLPSDFGKQLKEWKIVYEAEVPHKQALPGKWDSDLNDDGVPFERCCILRCLRPDRVVPMVTAFVSENMEQKFVEPPPFNLEECFNDSTCMVPLIFILSPGQDPMSQLLKFGDARGFGGKRTNSISLGQGQGPIAKKLIMDAQSNGSWVVLQNCHLAVSWMTTLEKICEDMLSGGQSQDYRLWLTSCPSPAFPVSILQNGVKMTNEPPLGLRANLLGSFIQDPISDPSFFEGVGGPNAHGWKPLLLGLCFFHAVIQERRKYGPIGWNIPYEFNTSDLRICVRQLRSFLESYESMPLAALRYTTGECNYGGRVTDDKDRRCLNALLLNFYNDDAISVGYSFQATGTAESRAAFAQPKADTHEEYMAALRALPQFPSPEVFGLHPNAAITKELKETRELFTAILLTQSTVGGGAGGGDDMLAAIAEDISSKLPADFDLDAAKALYPVEYLQSMNTVLHQELIRFNRLTEIVRSSLNNLKKAIKGLVVMDANLEAVANALMTGARPAMWMKRSYPSLKPLAGYVSDMMRRLKFFADWIKTGIPTDFWISGFFFTQAFLTGASQNFARKHTLPIDQIDFAFSMLTIKVGESPPPEDGVHVFGMYLEGARYHAETKVLQECEPKVLFTEIPMMWFRPMQVDAIDHGKYYNCPLYKESARRGVLATTGHSSNFVMMLKLPSDVSENHWVKRGVAGLLALDD